MQPLVKDRNQIRVLNLHPSHDFGAPITCDIQIVSLDDDPVFDALSWCWGSAEDTAEIIVCDTPFDTSGVFVYQTSFSCRQNLESALRHLRDKDECVTLWVDAVCINQDDIAEKNSQILLMSRIYSHAQTVRIWLGEATDDSSEAVRVLKQLQIQPDLKSVKLDGQELSAEQLWAFTSLLKRPWFKRMWVVQEYALARQRLFYCGFDHFSMTNLGTFLGFFHDNLLTSGPFYDENPVTADGGFFDSFRNLAHLVDVSDMISEGKQHDIGQAFKILRALSGLNATDPRDKVYGCLGLLPGFDELITIDYNSPVKAFYAGTTYALFCRMQCFKPLCYTSLEREIVSLELPSWSFNFASDSTGPGRRGLFDHFSAAGEWGSWTTPRLVYPLLWIRGTFFDEVVSTHHVVPDIKADMGNFYDVGRQRFLHTRWRSFFGLDLDRTAHEAYVGGGPMENAYWRTVVCDLCTYDAFRTWSRIQLKDINALVKWIRNPKSHSVRHWYPDWDQNRSTETYLDAMHKATSKANAHLFRTKRGFIGMSVGPSDIQAGDQLHLIPRGEVPFAFRPVQHDNQESVFELVCQCYVHGIMDGEAVTESPLPHSRSFRQHELRRQLFGGQPLDRDFPVGDWQDIALR